MKDTYKRLSDDKSQSFSFDTTEECRLKFSKLKTIVQPSPLLINFINEQIRAELNTSLTFIDVFIQQCINLIDTAKQNLLDNDLVKGVDLQYNKYEERVRGCGTKCPCCGRICDVEHHKALSTAIGSDGNKHQCLRGHQFQAMNGFKVRSTNEPSFLLCDSMKDNDQIFHSGKYIKWKEFKNNFKDWSFDVKSQQEATVWKARCVFIWNKIGKDLCDKFKMSYVKMPKDLPPRITDPIHFVLVLDESGSMRGDPWKALSQSVTNFLKIRQNEGNPEDRVSIIHFSNAASIKFFNEKINPSIVYRLNPDIGGGTDYALALKCVIQVMTKAKLHTNNYKFGIVFMSDGDALSPNAELLEIKNTWLKHIYKFWCIGFKTSRDSNFEVLSSMCQTLNGDNNSFMKPLDPFELTSNYVTIARE